MLTLYEIYLITVHGVGKPAVIWGIRVNGDQYIRVNPSNAWNVDPGYPKPIQGNWPGVTGTFANGLDAALWSDTTRKIYFFKGSEYLRINPSNGWNVDPGYPRSIAGNWPGFPAAFVAGIDSALWSETNQKIYCFKDAKYIRLDPNSGWNVDPGYPRWINKNWIAFPENA